MPDFPDLPEPQQIAGETEAQRDRYGRLIAVATVVTTLLAASTAFLQAEALRRDDEAAVRAERLTAQSLGARVNSQSGAELQYQRFQLAENQRKRAANARQLALFATGVDSRSYEREEDRWLQVAERTVKGTKRLAKDLGFEAITETGKDGPEDDPTFPDRYFARYQRDAIRLEALKDGANAEGDRAEEQFVDYAVSLTLFAVAVFLFGYSLTPAGSRQRKLFAGTAAVLVTGGAIWTASTAIDSPDRPPDEASEAYADGVTAMRTLDYEGAVEHFDKAIELRDDFAKAYAGRADARSLARSPNPNAISLSADAETLEANIEDYEKSVDLDEDRAPYKLVLASNLFLLGLENDDEGMLEEALEMTQEGKVAYTSSPAGEYNEAAMLLALGRVEDAEEAYDRAIQRTLFLDVEKKEKRDDIVQRANFVGAAFTDLELVQAHDESLADEVAAIKERIVEPISAEALPPDPPDTRDGIYPEQDERREGPPAELADITVTPLAGSLEWLAGSAENLDGAKDRIYTVWYQRNEDTGTWFAHGPITGEATANELKVTTDGQAFIRRSFLSLTRPPTCVPEGDWRVEVFVNGRLAGTGEGSTEFPEVEAVQARDLSLTACIPPDWELSDSRLPGLVRGWQSKDGRSGASLWVLNEGILNTGDQGFDDADRLLDVALPAFSFVLPAGVGGSEPNDAPFMKDLAGETVRTYALARGRLGMLAGIGFAPDGEVIVGMAWGPFDGNDEFFVSEVTDRVFFSFSQY